MDFTIEELAMNAWPSLKTLLYDGWIIRLSNGYGNRANSVNPIYPSRIKPEDKFRRCDELFTSQNLMTTYKITECDEHEIIDNKLEKMNHKIINETSIQVCRIPEKPAGKYKGIIVKNDFEEKWIKSIIVLNRVEEKHVSTFRKILENIAVPKIVVQKEIENEIIGCGCGVMENNHVGVFDIVVKESFRGKGYGSEIVKTILAEAGKRGVENSYLQVMLDNTAALHLYKKLGYNEKYKYWYRKKTAG